MSDAFLQFGPQDGSPIARSNPHRVGGSAGLLVSWCSCRLLPQVYRLSSEKRPNRVWGGSLSEATKWKNTNVV